MLLPWMVDAFLRPKPTPSTDRIVASGSASVAAWRACARASVPARVEKAN